MDLCEEFVLPFEQQHKDELFNVPTAKEHGA
jgi:hypothetical protein